jgi:hypothetical protein
MYSKVYLKLEKPQQTLFLFGCLFVNSERSELRFEGWKPILSKETPTTLTLCGNSNNPNPVQKAPTTLTVCNNSNNLNPVKELQQP